MKSKTKKLGLLIRDFATDFTRSNEPFMNGFCYHFAVILRDLFDGEVWYNPIDNHYVTKINGDLYDARGVIQSNLDSYVPWEEYKKEDPLHAERLMQYCVYKTKDLYSFFCKSKDMYEESKEKRKDEND